MGLGVGFGLVGANHAAGVSKPHVIPVTLISFSVGVRPRYELIHK